MCVPDPLLITYVRLSYLFSPQWLLWAAYTLYIFNCGFYIMLINVEYKIKLLLFLEIAPSTKLDSKDEKNVSNGEICQLLH